MAWEPSYGNEDSEKQLNLTIFRQSVTKSGESWKNVIGQKAVGAKCSKLEERARPVHSDSSLHLGDKDAPFPQV